MVNIDIPTSTSHASSSYSGTPLLTINKDAAIDLDSSNAFEGPEKLLEVWFSTAPGALPIGTAPGGLKVVPAETWKDMLDLVSCKVLSIVESEHVDAYLLSESSMFVFPHKLILKTCGTTTLLRGLPRILEIAATIAKFPHTTENSTIGTAAYPYRVFYSRKNFLFPDRQHGPHRSWNKEVKALDGLFQRGSAYVIGKLNGEHWYLYLTEPNTLLTPPSTPDREQTQNKYLELPVKKEDIDTAQHINGDGNSDNDETLEILMTDLDQDNAQQFYLANASKIAEGVYLDKAQDVRTELRQAVGKIENLPSRTPAAENLQLLRTIDEEDDIFSSTSSDPNDLLCADNDPPTIPDDLTMEGHTLGTVVSETCGLAEIYPTARYPDARVDAYLFTPCGFSANGVIPAPNGPDATHYFTVHVTPEPHCSYASFETNVPSKQTGRETNDVIEQVVNIFKPGRFSVTFFEAKKDFEYPIPSPSSSSSATDTYDQDSDAAKLYYHMAKKRDTRGDTIRNYRRVDKIVHDFDGYDLIFKYFERLDYTGGGLRIGENDY